MCYSASSFCHLCVKSSSESIRQVLRNRVLRPDMLDDDQLKAAYTMLAKVNALSAEKRRTRQTGMLPPLPLPHDADEHVNDTLWHDKTQAGGGG